MKVILTQEVPKLGARDDIVEVADGYARNYLIPQGLAVKATRANLNKIEHREQAKEKTAERTVNKLQRQAAKIDGYTLILTVNAGEEGRLFGSVTTQDIASGIEESLGVEVDRRKIILDEPIKELGTYTVEVRLHPEVSANIKVDVLTER